MFVREEGEDRGAPPYSPYSSLCFSSTLTSPPSWSGHLLFLFFNMNNFSFLLHSYLIFSSLFTSHFNAFHSYITFPIFPYFSFAFPPYATLSLPPSFPVLRFPSCLPLPASLPSFCPLSSSLLRTLQSGPSHPQYRRGGVRDVSCWQDDF